MTSFICDEVEFETDERLVLGDYLQKHLRMESLLHLEPSKVGGTRMKSEENKFGQLSTSGMVRAPPIVSMDQNLTPPTSGCQRT